jgi:hypothetical protein
MVYSLGLVEVLEDEANHEEVRGHGNGEYGKWSEFPTQSQPQKEVKQYNMQTVIHEMGTAEANAILC